MSLEDQIILALRTLKDPLSAQDIVSAQLVQGLQIKDNGNVFFTLEANPKAMEEFISLKEKAASLLKLIPGISNVHIVLTAQRKSKRHSASRKDIFGIRHIIAIASGKGGVGKSTTAVNLAGALRVKGLKVGILDGDIYGPSLPRLLGINQKPTSDNGNLLNPIDVYGVKAMSMGFLIDENRPAIWRGPMVQKAFQQMLCQVKWGELDVLIIDLPPGTGDIQLTLIQTVTLSGAIIVSTPQDLALIDARKAFEMFLKVHVPVIGFVENMSYFICPHCHKRSDIFEHGGVIKEAEAVHIPLLAEIPLHISIREASEKGKPMVFLEPGSLLSKVYLDFAEKVHQLLCI